MARISLLPSREYAGKYNVLVMAIYDKNLWLGEQKLYATLGIYNLVENRWNLVGLASSIFRIILVLHDLSYYKVSSL